MNNELRSNESGIKAMIVALAIVFIWFGGIKLTEGGANGISGLVTNSPLLSWVYGIFGVGTFGALLGLVEIVIGLLLIGGLTNLKLRAIAGLAGIATFLVTLSFMFTTPGVVPAGASFPMLSGMPGEFLLKDIVLLAVSYGIFASGDLGSSGNNAS